MIVNPSAGVFISKNDDHPDRVILRVGSVAVPLTGNQAKNIARVLDSAADTVTVDFFEDYR